MLLLLLHQSGEAPPIEYDFVEFDDVTVKSAAYFDDVTLEPTE